MIIERKPKLVQIVDTAAELADATAETKNTQQGDRRCTFARNDVILDCSDTLYDTKTARKIIPPATTTKLWMENNHIDSLEKKDIRDTYQGLADLREVSFKNNFIRKVEGKGESQINLCQNIFFLQKFRKTKLKQIIQVSSRLQESSNTLICPSIKSVH